MGGSFIPESVVGLDFALTAFFLALCIMVILVFYTVRNTPVSVTPLTVAVASGLITTAGLHFWRSNATLSVLGGTAAHVVLASTLPIWA